ncbi:hypothetical protein JTE88_03000 [Arcanobacterium phocisimile]|uniref:Uncharacterized protein n=1 Tax=Arcanobacterium phocisimile TaxID=1302235 RepID=A0ABX7IKS5_9ACTO|nr:hypothetical protein [Arcanobacterium phocisimile]QRV02720.1 hypothetical protein JTE88_03000 [Arcanobacterium phocisimile]
MFIKKYGVFLVSLMMVVSACSSVDSGVDVDSSESSSMGLNLSAEVDKESWTVTLPWNRYLISDEEKNILLSASSMALAQCTREKNMAKQWTGTNADFISQVNPHVYSEFGPWRKAMAQQYGFSSPYLSNDPIVGRDIKPPTETEILKLRRGFDANSLFSEADMELMRKECDEYPAVEKFNREKIAPSAPWVDELGETRMLLFDDPRAQEIVGELEACFDKQGMKMSSEIPGFVEGVNGFIDPTEESIALALKAAQCQEETDATPRLAQVWADLQAPIVKKYAKELIAQRQLIDERVAEAKQYIQEHPELLELPAQ